MILTPSLDDQDGAEEEDAQEIRQRAYDLLSRMGMPEEEEDAQEWPENLEVASSPTPKHSSYRQGQKSEEEASPIAFNGSQRSSLRGNRDNLGDLNSPSALGHSTTLFGLSPNMDRMFSPKWAQGFTGAFEKTTEAFHQVEQKATKGITEALEKTGEALHQAEQKATRRLLIAEQGLTDALEKTGEAITQAATKARPRNTPESTDEKIQGKEASFHPSSLQNLNANSTKVLKNLQMGWSSVVETTKRTVEATKDAVDIERMKLEENFLGASGKFYKRDPKLPLDVEALRDAEVVYITDRIITMGHPAMASNVKPSITAQRKLAAIGHLLNRRHDGRYLVWNLSEVEYKVSILDDQVLTFSFPGSPSPPLGLLLKLLVSMENWMKADERNVAVVHCLTGKGRTSIVLAAFLCWMGEAGFGDMNQALEYIAKCKKITPEELTIPSQRRYASYFKNMLDGVRPSQPPLRLKRIIMSEAPKFASGPVPEMVETEDGKSWSSDSLMGCAPYLQIFKAGKLIFTTAATLHVQQVEEELPFVQVKDGAIPFKIEEILHGDILIRCRHLTFNKQRVSMFRAAFHTGYLPPNVMRLTKSQLDGACSDKRFSDDFFLDLIFEKVDAETATRHLEDEVGEVGEEQTSNATTKRKGHGAVVTASNFDAMLQGESRFWDVIMNRRQEQNKEKSRDTMFGKTIGRRRGGKGKQENETTDRNAGESLRERSALETFSIGNELDFLPEEPEVKRMKPVQKDSLMEALHALDDIDTEEIIFDGTPPVKAEPIPETTLVEPKTLESDTSRKDLLFNADTTSEEATPVPSQTSSGNIDELDALLASADADLADMNLDDFDVDDDLDDLEAMLQS